MGAIFKIADGVPCRACGGVLALAHGNEYGLCGTCWTSVRRHSGVAYSMHSDPDRKRPKEVTDADVTEWLTHRLVLDLKRLDRDGMTGRCEAISGWAYGDPGHQCAKPATHHREGRKVCLRHAKATAPVFVDSDRADAYSALRYLITTLAAKDALFARIIRETPAPVTPLPPSDRMRP